MTHVKVYVDGACRNNGHNNPQGGCGVYWDPTHPLNSSEQLRGDVQTNNRAELSAAIIAVAQGITVGYTELEIITDSKYVKLGITKWIHEWKINGWKTSRTGKRKGDVLNKDLWVMLDSLTDRLNVIWTWVEGHQEVEGNLQADTFAKKGILAERYVWQDIGRELFENMNVIFDLDDNPSTPVIQMGKKQESLRFTCKKCLTDCVEGGNCIQCQNCKSWIHYTCSKLPPYHLFLYESTQRKYTCECCVEVDEEFIIEYRPRIENEIEFKTDTEGRSTDLLHNKSFNKLTVSTQTEATIIITTDANHESVSCQTEEPSHTGETLKTTIIRESKLCQTEEQMKTANMLHVSKSLQTEEPSTTTNIYHESMSSQTEEPFYDFELFKTSSITILQESFVRAFDKINDSIRTLKINQSEENDMKQRVTLLTKENERLKEANKTETKDMPKPKVACQSCSEGTARIEKLNKMLATEKEKSQQSLDNVTVVKETQISKSQADMELLRHQLELSEKKNKTFEQEISLLEMRLETKNDCLTKLEAQKCNLFNKIAKLEDEVMSWKLHECRAEGEALFEQAKGKLSKLTEEAFNNTREDIREGSEERCNHQTGTRELEAEELNAPQSLLTTIDDSLKHSKNINESRNSDIDAQVNASADSKKLKVQIVGTSNIKFLSPEYIGEEEFEVSKINKYTLDETYNFMEGLTPIDRHDAFILHSLCNDIGTKSPEECSNHMKRIINSITKKYADTKVIVSLGLPRLDKVLNRRIEKTNILIKEMASEIGNVYICDNSNLFYRGEAQKGILNEDGLHLARSGTRKLGRNMKEALWGTFDIPIIVRYETSKENQNNSETPFSVRKSPAKNQPQNAVGERKTHVTWNMEHRPNNTSNVTWNGDRRLYNNLTHDGESQGHSYHGAHEGESWSNDNSGIERRPQNNKFLQNGDKWSSTRNWERRTHDNYSAQDRGRQPHDNYSSRKEEKWSHRNHGARDRETRSQDNCSTRNIGRRSLNNYDTQDNNWGSHDNIGAREGIWRSHDNINWESEKDSNYNSRKRERLWYSNHGTMEDEMGSYSKNGTRDREWGSHHTKSSRVREKRSHYYRDDELRSRSSYGKRDGDRWSQNRLLSNDQNRWYSCDNSYGTYRY